MILALIVSIVLTAIAVPCVDPLLRVLGLTSGYTYESAKVFITTIYSGLFTQIFYNLICAFLRSIGDSLTPFLFLAGSTLLSVGLDFYSSLESLIHYLNLEWLNLDCLVQVEYLEQLCLLIFLSLFQRLDVLFML